MSASPWLACARWTGDERELAGRPVLQLRPRSTVHGRRSASKRPAVAVCCGGLGVCGAAEERCRTHCSVSSSNPRVSLLSALQLVDVLQLFTVLLLQWNSSGSWFLLKEGESLCCATIISALPEEEPDQSDDTSEDE